MARSPGVSSSLHAVTTMWVVETNGLCVAIQIKGPEAFMWHANLIEWE